ncbi:MAG: type II secretion system protein N [Halothiobacillaceae bacterium]
MSEANPDRPVDKATRRWPKTYARTYGWLLGLFLFSWLITVVATWPLETVTRWFEPPLGAKIVAVDGSIWNGRATLLWSGQPPVEASIRFRPAALLRLSAEWQLTAQSDQATVEAGISPRRSADGGLAATISHLDAHIAAGASWLKDIFPLPIDGRLDVIGRDLKIAATGHSGLLTLTWPEATLDLAQRLPLGRLVAEVELNDGMLMAQIRSAAEAPPGSPLVDLVLEGPADGTLTVHGHLDPAGDEELTRQLLLLGSPGADGRIRIEHHLAPDNQAAKWPDMRPDESTRFRISRFPIS